MVDQTMFGVGMSWLAVQGHHQWKLSFRMTVQLTTVMGIHSCNLAIPILLEEASKMESKLPDTTIENNPANKDE